MANKFASALKKNTPPPIEVKPEEASSPHDRPARRGTKHIGGYFEPEVSKQLRKIALDEDTSVQELLAEAIDMIFHSRQMPTIAKKPKS